MFEALGPFIHRHRVLTLLLAGAFMVVAGFFLWRGGTLTSGNIKGLEAERADALVEQVTGHPAQTTFVAVFQSTELDPSSQAYRDAVKDAVTPLRGDARVASVVTADDAPKFLAPDMVARDARSSFAIVTLKGDLKEAIASYPAVRAELKSAQLAITCTGHVPFVNDLNTTLEHDLVRAELISFPVALLVLLLVFRTVVAAALPVGVGALSVAGGIAAVFALSRHADIAQYTVNVCSLIGLGLAIDYSLFTVSRYREELAKGRDYETALTRTMATSGRVVAFSGVAVLTGLAGLLFFEGSYLVPMGIGGMIVVGLAVFFALTFLPALLAILGPKIHAGRLPFEKRTPPEGTGAWHRMAAWVMRRPVLVLVPTLGVLLLMGVPFLHLRLAAADVRVLDHTVEARQGYDLLRHDFPKQAESRVVVAVQFPTAPALDANRVGALYDLSRRIAAVPNVSRVESIVDSDPRMGRAEYQQMLVHPPQAARAEIEAAERLSVGERVVVLTALVANEPDSQEARDVIRAIRTDRKVGDGTLLVGGQIANDLDATRYVLDRAPRALTFIIVTMLVMLFLLLGSVILPLKAVAMNFVSITGSFGALVWIFQDGHFFVREPRPLEPALPVLLFCVLFGLSMDYEVLMLSRIKESYERTGDNTRAVAEGLERSAGLITSAAAIMVAVFLSFAAARVVVVQAVGVGMAIAVAVDATLVRVLLVPSTMRLFGDLNWWAPRPLVWLRERLGLANVSHA